MVDVALGCYSFVRKDLSFTPRTVLLRIIRLQATSVSGFEVYVARPILGTILLCVAHFTIEFSVGSVVVVEGVQEVETVDTTVTVFVVPFAITSDHFLGLIDLALAFWTTILTILICFDDPCFYG